MASIGRYNSKVHGLKEARENFARLPEVARKRFEEGSRGSAQMIVARAKLRVPVRFGFLRDAIDYAFDKKSGVALVGARKEKHIITGRVGMSLKAAQSARVSAAAAKVAQPSKYLHLIEFGTSRTKAQPTIGPAAAAEKPNFERAMRQAGTDVERDLAASRFV